MAPHIHPNMSAELEQVQAYSVMNFTVKDKFEINLSPWTSSVCRSLIISTISSATPGGTFFLLFLSPSSPVCFYPCKMLVALLKYCSALSALFFLPLVPLLLLLLPSPCWSPLDGLGVHYPPTHTPPLLVVVVVVVEYGGEGGAQRTGLAERGGGGSRSSRDPMTWVRHVTVAQERKSIHERMRSTGVDYRLGPWLLEGWRAMGGGGV